MLFDSHAHLNFEDFQEDWQDVIAGCQANDVWMTNIGSQLATSRKAVEIAEQYSRGVYAAVGLHPIHVEGSDFHPEKFNSQDYKDLIRSSNKVVAIGETGLDFFHDDKNIENQKKVFIEHIALAKESNLPLIIHSRNSKEGDKDAYEALYQIVKEQGVKDGVVHCFGGTPEQAQNFMSLGFYIGFTGVITFDKTGQLAHVVQDLPLDAILIETDCPYLAPEPHRGQRNIPQYVEFVARKIAEIKDMDYKTVAEKTFENAKVLYRIG